MIAILIALMVVWSWVCVTAGRIYEIRQRLAEMEQAEAAEMNARDEWANQMERTA